MEIQVVKKWQNLDNSVLLFTYMEAQKEEVVSPQYIRVCISISMDWRSQNIVKKVVEKNTYL